LRGSEAEFTLAKNHLFLTAETTSISDADSKIGVREAFFWLILRENCPLAANPTGEPIRNSRPAHLNNVHGIQNTYQLFY
jgi:hypothetical protein